MKINNDDVIDVIRLAADGWSARRIAVKYQVHRTYIAGILQGKARQNVHPEHPIRAVWMKMQVDRLAALRQREVNARNAYPAAVADYRRGYSLRAAGAKHGIHWTSLERELQRLGIRRRATGKWPKVCHLRNG